MLEAPLQVVSKDAILEVGLLYRVFAHNLSYTYGSLATAPYLLPLELRYRPHVPESASKASTTKEQDICG